MSNGKDKFVDEAKEKFTECLALGYTEKYCNEYIKRLEQEGKLRCPLACKLGSKWK